MNKQPDIIDTESTPKNAMVRHEEESVQLGVIQASTPDMLVKTATAAATSLAAVIDRQKLFSVIQGKRFVRCEGWTTLAAMMGVMPHEVSVEDKDGTFTATVELRKIADGTCIGRASAECGMDEATWAKRSRNARRSMALTRATGKACRLSFSWVMALAGYEVTPAEEVAAGYQGHDDDEPRREERYEPLQPVQPTAGKASKDMTPAEKLWVCEGKIKVAATEAELDGLITFVKQAVYFDEVVKGRLKAAANERHAFLAKEDAKVEGEQSRPFEGPSKFLGPVQQGTSTASTTNLKKSMMDSTCHSDPQAPADQKSRVAWYIQQVPLAKQGKWGEGLPQEQLRRVIERSRKIEMFNEVAVAGIAKDAYIALAELAESFDELQDIHEEASWLQGPDADAVDRKLSMRQVQVSVSQGNPF